MCDIDLEPIKARCEAATEGPWERHDCPPCFERGHEDVQIWAGQGNIPITQWLDSECHNVSADAEFIAHARTDVPALVAEVERLHALLTAEPTEDEVALAVKAVHRALATEWMTVAHALAGNQQHYEGLLDGIARAALRGEQS